MLVTWRYRARGSLIQSFDPRAWWIFYACFLASVLVFWDVRFQAVFLAVTLFFIFTSRLTWQESRRAWLLIGTFITVYVVLTFLTGRGGIEAYSEEHLIARWVTPFTIFGWLPRLDITLERSFFAISQLLRIFNLAGLTILIPYSLNPIQYGAAFRGLGLPDKIAYAIDLTMRFVPTFGRDFQVTLDAQRARGYEVEKLRGGLIAQVRKMAPLIVPVTIHAIISSEDIIDAMDLRAFGTGPRTWLEQLHYRGRDYVLTISGILIILFSVGLSLLGLGKFWAPPIDTSSSWLSEPRARELALSECRAAYDLEIQTPRHTRTSYTTLGIAYKKLNLDPAYETRPLNTPAWLVVMRGRWQIFPPSGNADANPPIIFGDCWVILEDREDSGAIVTNGPVH